MPLGLDSEFVKRGLWTDLSKGPILGKTITTDPKTGNLVVALLAILSTLGTAHLWHLLAFALHQFRANGRPADALFRQQQALLRTLPSPSSVVADVFKLWWTWRKKAERPFLRSIFLGLFALLFTAATIAASVFSSLVVDSGTIPILVNSPFCGKVNVSDGVSFRTYNTDLQQTAPGYTYNCYRNGTLSSTCYNFMSPNVPLRISDAPCPFNQSLCATKEGVTIDSGLVDVSKTFGLNLAPEDGVKFQKKTTCAILPIEGYYEIMDFKDAPPHWIPARGIIPGEQVVALYYGRTIDSRSNQTFFASLSVSNNSASPIVAGGRTHYGINPPEEPQSWYPLDGFNVSPDSDVMWKPVMGNAAAFVNPVNDPLYLAHKAELEFDDLTLVNYTRYISDYVIRGVGCRHQYKICHARKGKSDFCSPFQGAPYWLLTAYDFPESSPMQQAVLELLLFSNSLYPTSSVHSSLASRMVSRSQMTIESLPDDFWKKEVTSWEAESWAALQILVAQYAIGPKVSDENADKYWVKPETSSERQLCQSVKMRKTGAFVNINVFGLTFVVSFSIFVTFLDITLLKFLIYVSRFRRGLGPHINRWVQDGVWQLQRRAYEGEGHRDWTNLEKEIPLTDNGRKLKDLPILWLPGKSPAAFSSETFSSTSSINSRQAELGITVNQGQEVDGATPKRVFGFLRLW